MGVAYSIPITEKIGDVVFDRPLITQLNESIYHMKARHLLPLLIPGSSLSLKTTKAKYSVIWHDEGRDIVGKALEIAHTKKCYQIAQK